MIPHQTPITADSHEADFDVLHGMLRQLDRATIKTIRNCISKRLPTLVQGFPARVVLPERLDINALKNAVQGLVKPGWEHNAHNAVIQRMSKFMEEKPEVFLSLINDVFKAYEFDEAQFE